MRLAIFCTICSLAFGCGTPEPKSNNDSNNGGSNNGTSNNGGSNNGASNNGGSNNGSTGAECDDFSNVLATLREPCADDIECEMRGSKCGCPTAVLVDSDQSELDRLLEVCDFSETCSLIDCAEGSGAACVAGTCQLTNE